MGILGTPQLTTTWRNRHTSLQDVQSWGSPSQGSRAYIQCCRARGKHYAWSGIKQKENKQNPSFVTQRNLFLFIVSKEESPWKYLWAWRVPNKRGKALQSGQRDVCVGGVASLCGDTGTFPRSISSRATILPCHLFSHHCSYDPAAVVVSVMESPQENDALLWSYLVFTKKVIRMYLKWLTGRDQGLLQGLPPTW